MCRLLIVWRGEKRKKKIHDQNSLFLLLESFKGIRKGEERTNSSSYAMDIARQGQLHRVENI